jgi:hypothetical protein
MILPLEIPNSPALTIFLITDKNSLKTFKPSLLSKFPRNRHETLAPPYAEVGNIRFGTAKYLIRRYVDSES